MTSSKEQALQLGNGLVPAGFSINECTIESYSVVATSDENNFIILQNWILNIFKTCNHVLFQLILFMVKYLAGALVQKISKCRFFKDIENSFQEVTHTGLEPHQFFFFLEYLNKYSCWRRPKFWPKWAMASRLFELWPKFFVKFAQTCDEQMLKISRRYLNSCLS